MSYILGLDLGETSLGIAVLNEQNGEPISLDSMGVRIFPDGREDKTKSPLCVKRRESRGTRRNLDRKLRRKEKLINFLIENNLISQNEEERLELKKLNSYELRTKGLDKKLTLNELSRALIHINQRRGFLSNRKTDGNDSSDLKNAIQNTITKIDKLGFRTLGEYLYSLQKNNNHNTLRVKIETRQENKIIDKIDKKTGEISQIEKLITITDYNYYPSRELYKREVNKILNKQLEFYPELNNKFFDKELNKEISIKDKIIDIIFYQRDLKPQEVGKCPFEPEEYRIAKASPLFQEFRLLSNLRNLEIYPNSTRKEPLTNDEKNKIFNLLKKQKTVTFKGMRKELKIDNIFNLEESSKGSHIRDELEGMPTDIEIKKYIKNWDNIDPNKKEEYIEKFISNTKDDEIIEYFTNENIELTEEVEVNKNTIDENGKNKKIKVKEATDWHHLLNIKLEEGYGNLSRKALEKITKEMKDENLRYDQACEKIYGSHSQKNKNKVYDELPYYGEILERSCIKQPNVSNEDEIKYGKITNVTVHIGLNEIRKAVNDIIKEKGEKPSYIAIEIARELKMNKKDKKNLEDEQKEDKKIVEEAIKEITENNVMNKENIKKDDIYKYRIWRRMASDPLNRRCPFCGKQISITNLFSSDSHIEHLLPFSRSYDDSINNKVIACDSCNNTKGNKTPFEAFGHTQQWDDIVSRSLLLPKKMQWRFKENAMAINMDNLNKEFYKDKYFGNLWKTFTDDEKHEIANILFDKTQNHKEFLLKYNLTDNQINAIIQDFDGISKSILSRMIKDTQYLSRAASEYLDCLYPNDGKNHIRVSPGKLTSMLRYNWGLENIIQSAENINENNIKKDRTDHRHHAIDAFVVACTTTSTLNKISKASGRTKIQKTDKLLSEIEPPYKNFKVEDIKSVFDNIIISYKEDHKGLKQAKAKSGSIAQLHNDTNYGLIEDIDGEKGIFATRKPFLDLDKELIMKNPHKDNKYIADEKIRKDLQELVSDISNKEEIKRILENYSQTSMKRKNGTPIIIKTIRIHEIKPYKSLMSVKNKKTNEIYKYAETDGNYCAEIYIPNRGKKEGKWCIEIISNFDAHKKDFISKWKKEEPEAKLIMKLFINDMVEIEINENNKDTAIKKLLPFAKDNKIIARVKKMTNGLIYLRPHNIAKENKADEFSWQGSGEGLQIANTKRIKISALGKITYLKK